jgi:two-component system sensor histidine kinase/response regulator
MATSILEAGGAGTGAAGTGIDRELALSRVGGDNELLHEIAVLFLDDYPKLLDELKTARSRNDAKVIERTAHSLKGSVSNFGASAAVEAAFALENMGRTQQLADVEPGLRALELALATLRPELEAL